MKVRSNGKGRQAAPAAPAVAKSAIETANDELAALVKSQTAAEEKAADPADLLAKSADATLAKGAGPGDGEGPGGQVISGGKGPGEGDQHPSSNDGGGEGEEEVEEDEEDEEEEGEEAREKSLRGAIYSDLMDHPTYGRVVEASPALEHLTTVMGKSFEFVASLMKSQERQIATLRREVATLAASHATTQRALAMHMKSFGPGAPGLAKSQTQPGVMGRTGNVITDAQADKANGVVALAKSEVAHRLTRAMSEGKVEPDVVTAFEARGPIALTRVPEDVRKHYGIPDPPQAG